MADNKEPQKGQQSQAPTQTPAAKPQQAPAAPKTEQAAPTQPAPAEAPKPKGPEAERRPTPKPAPAAPKAQTPATPVVLLRSDVMLLESGQFRALLDKRRRIAEVRSGLLAKLALNDIEWREVEERIKFYLTPSPIFDASAIPDSGLVARQFDDTRAILREVVGMVTDLSDKVEEVNTEALVERIMGRMEGLRLAPPDTAEGQHEAAELDEIRELQPDGGQEDPDTFFDMEDEGEEALVVAEVPDHEWMDAATAPEFGRSLDGLPLELLTLDGVGDLTIVACSPEMSGHISAFGAEIARQDAVSKACVYVRFKQAPKEVGKPWRVSEMYRYSVVDVLVYEGLVEQAELVMSDTEGASIGSYVERSIKALHEKGLVVCQKLDRGTGQWVTVPTRAERSAAKTVAPAPAQASRPVVPARQQTRPGGPMASVGELVREKMGTRGPARTNDTLGDAFLTE